MGADTKISVHGVDVEERHAPLRRAPTLYLIIFFKLAKGLLAVFLSTVLYFQPANNLPTE
jgi:hypothetical protein